MARPQPGVAPPPQRYGLSVIYQIKDVPMHAMSIAHLGAMVPGLAAETGEANSSVKVNYLVGFGSLLGSFIPITTFFNASCLIKFAQEGVFPM